MEKKDKRYSTTYISPSLVFQIIDNEGIKQTVKNMEEKTGKRLAYILNSHYELLIVPRGRKRLYTPDGKLR